MNGWCAGYGRNPHVPDCGLVEINPERGLKLCKDDCWRRWNAANYGDMKPPTEGNHHE